MFLTVFSILLFIRVCNHVFSDPDTRRHVPRYIRASRAVACDNLPLRASTHLREAVPFFNRKFHRYFLLKRKLRQEYRHSAGVFTSVTIFRCLLFSFMNDIRSGFWTASSMHHGTYHRVFSLLPSRAPLSPLSHRNSRSRYLPRGAA